MPLQTPSNLYSGGAVVFNTAPSSALAMNLLARKQAKQDALNQYYREQDAKINPAGMDTRYTPVLKQAEDERRQYWQANRDKLMNPNRDVNGQAQSGYDALYQRSQGIINEGKQAALDRKADLDRMMELNKSDMLTPALKEQFSNAYDIPLDSKKWKPLDRSVFLDAEKPYDYFKDSQEAYKNVKLSEGNEYGPTDPKTSLRDVITKYDYNDDAKKQIQSIAAARYNAIPQYHKLINSLMHDDATTKRVNDYSKQAFGHTIDVADPEQFAAAYDLMNLPKGNVKQTKEIDQIAENKLKFGQQKELAAINDAYTKGHIKLQHALSQADKGTQDLWIDSHLENKIAAAQPKRTKIGDQWQDVKELPLDPVLEKALVVNGSTADFIQQLPDGRFVYGLYEREKDKQGTPKVNEANGNYAIDKNSERFITKEDLKVAMGKQFGLKQLNKEMSAGSKPAKKTKALPLD